MFFLRSDLLWYCDDCENVLGSRPDDNIEDLEESDAEIIRCPECNNLVDIENLEEDYLCPICGEFLGDEMEKIGYTYNEELEKYVKY